MFSIVERDHCTRFGSALKVYPLESLTHRCVLKGNKPLERIYRDVCASKDGRSFAINVVGLWR